jgi:hypothetical protein
MVVLVDEFRQGNVPPSKDITRLIDEAYETLPAWIDCCNYVC